jgi:crotonobetainyl-CoA:carnitine CoA-transferase CaiB-like acyl-CoA transferase
MFTAEQYRAKAAEYRGLLDTPRSPDETKEIRNLERTNTTMADNEEWLARNADKVVSASEYDIVPAAENDRARRAVLVEEHEHVLRCLGTAIMMRWNTLPTKLQRELFDHASSLDDFDRDDSISDLEQTAKLKERLARLLHHHNGERTQ